MENCNTFYVGIDEHKDSLVTATASSNEPWCRPAIKLPNNIAKIVALLKKLSKEGDVNVVYEAGPGGFVLQRELAKKGFNCQVAAPSLIPKIPGKHRKTDKLDATYLALSYRAGQLTFCKVPTAEQESTRTLLRCREDMSEDMRRTRLRILSFLRRQGLRCPAKNWTIVHRRWLKATEFKGELGEALSEYLAKLDYEESRLKSLDKRITEIAATPMYAQAVGYLRCLKGINTLSAMVLLTEIGDFSRFASARQFMAFLGLVPSEHSSGDSRRLGHITKSGNGRCRRILIEAAHSARHKPHAGYAVSRRRQGQPAEVVAIAKKAEKRLNSRFWYLSLRKNTKIAVTAVAREMSGFIWAIMRHKYLADTKIDSILSLDQRVV